MRADGRLAPLIPCFVDVGLLAPIHLLFDPYLLFEITVLRKLSAAPVVDELVLTAANGSIRRYDGLECVRVRLIAEIVGAGISVAS